MSDDQVKTDAANAGRSAEKKPYKAPELVSWGTMRDLTLAVGASGNSDGAMMNPSKTR